MPSKGKGKSRAGRPPGAPNKPGHKAGRPPNAKLFSPNDGYKQATLNFGIAGPSTSTASSSTQRKAPTETEEDASTDESDDEEVAPTDDGDEEDASEERNDSSPMEAISENANQTGSHLDSLLTAERHYCHNNLQEKAYDDSDDEDDDIFTDANDYLVPESDGTDMDDQQEEDLANIRVDSVINNYLLDLQKELSSRKKGDLPENYKLGTFWINPPSPGFLFRENEMKASPLYHPRVFLWLPLHLVPNGQHLDCPKCKTKLTSHCWLTDPCARRIIDIEDCFYLMTNRLICQEGHTIAGTDPDIIEQLPDYMQAEFPAVLTPSSGISKLYAKLMRILVQNSVGPTRQHRLLREMHMLRYDELEYKYLSANVIKYRGRAAFTNERPNVEEFSTFNDKSKYAGTVPSSGYLRYVYTSLISKIRPDLDKQMTLLDGTILAGDHSFKILDHLGKINSSSVFGALYTVLNEYEEVMVMLLTPTKAVTHLYQSFKSLYNRYTLNGFKLPALYYTDNPKQDRRFLEETLPSLLLDVQAKEDGATTYEEPLDETLVPMEIPEEVEVEVISSATGIQDVCNLILRSTQDESGNPSKHVYIGFDCEWPVSMQKGKKRNKVALIQIAFKKNVYLLHIVKIKRTLPAPLFTLLESDFVVKLGVRVKNDLEYVMQDYPKGTDAATKKPIYGKPAGAFDLGPFCKNRRFCKRLNPRLSELCKNVLGMQLLKPKNTRVSENWSRDVLQPVQIKYAALDAYAALAIFNELKDKEVANVKIIDTRPGLCVALFSGSRESPCAVGTLREPNAIENEAIAKSKRKNVVKQLAVVEVSKVLAPNLILRHHRLSDGSHATLADMGQLPFRVVFDLDGLKTAFSDDANEEPADLLSPNVPELAAESTIDADAVIDADADADAVTDADADAVIDADADIDMDTLSLDAMEVDAATDAVAVDSNAAGPDAADPDAVSYDDIDLDEPAEVFFESRISDAVPEHYTRVKKDIFHLMEMIPVSLRHGMSKQFKRAFRDALFMVDKTDKAAVKQAFIKMDKERTEEEKQGFWTEEELEKKWKEYVLCKSGWLWKRVRRYVPPAEELEPVVEALFKNYADAKCSKTGNKLFDKQARLAAQHVLKSIRLGYVSDPKGIPLYYKLKTGSYGLPIYRCVRGSNDVEGGIHMNIVRKFGSYNASPDLADCALADYRLRHNTDTGSLNRFGKVHKGHYNPWLTQAIDAWRSELGHPSYFSYHTAFGDHRDFLEPTSDLKESFGIAPVTNVMRNELAMIPFISEPSSKKTRPVGHHLPVKVYRMYSNQFEHLAAVQNVMYALIPVITDQEIKTYDRMIEQHARFVSPRNDATWMEFAKFWNEQEADGKNVFYKTGDHLKSHSNMLRDRATYYNTVLTNQNIVNAVRSLIDSRTTPVLLDAVELPRVEDRRDQVPEIQHVRPEEQQGNTIEDPVITPTRQQSPPSNNWQSHPAPHPHPYQHAPPFAQPYQHAPPFVQPYQHAPPLAPPHLAPPPGTYYPPATFPAPFAPAFGPLPPPPPPPLFFNGIWLSWLFCRFFKIP